MKVIIDIPQDHKRVIDNLVSDGKGYLLPHEVETRLARAVKIGTIIPDNATNGDIIKAMFPNAQIDYHKANELVEEYVTFYINGCDTCQDYTLEWWNAPYNSTQNLQDADKSGLEYADQPTLTSAT